MYTIEQQKLGLLIEQAIIKKRFGNSRVFEREAYAVHQEAVAVLDMLIEKKYIKNGKQ